MRIGVAQLSELGLELGHRVAVGPLAKTIRWRALALDRNVRPFMEPRIGWKAPVPLLVLFDELLEPGDVGHDMIARKSQGLGTGVDAIVVVRIDIFVALAMALRLASVLLIVGDERFRLARHIANLIVGYAIRLACALYELAYTVG
jgi:hypothetical protein